MQKKAKQNEVVWRRVCVSFTYCGSAKTTVVMSHTQDHANLSSWIEIGNQVQEPRGQ